ncbi:MAG: CoA transferase [Deltaproteobacteria bacterium]|nr:CoA transferase [Deltaproteobacteria bacterium]
MSGALSGFTIVDLTQGLCGPFGSMRLGDAGAEIIKIEPLTGDCSRAMGPPFIGDESAVFLSLNRNKKSVALDIHTPEGQNLVRQVVAKADVLLEDLGPGETEKLGLGYDTLRTLNPKLVYCAISAFGEEGPLRNMPGAELVIQAMADYTNSLGRIGEPPVRTGTDVASINTGIFASQAITAGLFHRMRKGEGQRVAVSMLGTLLHMRGIMWTAMTDPDEWYGFHLDHYTRPPDQGYKTKDGYVYFGLRRGNSEDWDRLLISLGMVESLSDPRFANFGRDATSIGRYAAEVKPLWEEGFKDMTSEEVVRLIHEFNGDAVPFLEYPQLVAHPQIAALGVVQEIDHPTVGKFKTIGPVWRFSDTPAKIQSPPPTLGQHTEEVLEKLGVSGDEMRRLVNAGIVGKA